MCYDAPDPPDLSGQTAASLEIAKEQAAVGREQLAWAREQDTMNRATLNRVLDIQLPAMEENARNAQADRKRYEETYQPIEDDLVEDFQSYDSQGRIDQERGRALADVSSTFDAARRNALQRLEGYGVDPSQTRNAALDIGVRTQQAAAQAAAATNATRNVEDKGRALRADAINIGRGLPSQVAQSYGTALQAGNSGVGNSNATTAGAAGAAQSSLGFTGQALGGYQQSANIASQGFGNQMTQFNANQAGANSLASGIGGLAGMAMYMNDGGEVPPEAARETALPMPRGGPVMHGPSDGTGIDDQVDAKLSVGEYVIPADVVAALGTKHFDKLLEKYHTPAAEQRTALPMR